MQGFHLDNFPLKTLKIDRVAFLLATLQSKCLDFQCYKMNIKNLSRPHVSTIRVQLFVMLTNQYIAKKADDENINKSFKTRECCLNLPPDSHN